MSQNVRLKWSDLTQIGCANTNPFLEVLETCVTVKFLDFATPEE